MTPGGGLASTTRSDRRADSRLEPPPGSDRDPPGPESCGPDCPDATAAGSRKIPPSRRFLPRRVPALRRVNASAPGQELPPPCAVLGRGGVPGGGALRRWPRRACFLFLRSRAQVPGGMALSRPTLGFSCGFIPSWDKPRAWAGEGAATSLFLRAPDHPPDAPPVLMGKGRRAAPCPAPLRDPGPQIRSCEFGEDTPGQRSTGPDLAPRLGSRDPDPPSGRKVSARKPVRGARPFGSGLRQWPEGPGRRALGCNLEGERCTFPWLSDANTHHPEPPSVLSHLRPAPLGARLREVQVLLCFS